MEGAKPKHSLIQGVNVTYAPHRVQVAGSPRWSIPVRVTSLSPREHGVVEDAAEVAVIESESFSMTDVVG